MLLTRSLSAKILTAFLTVLVAFGAVTTYGAITTRRLAVEVERVVGSYLRLRLDIHDIQTRQLNLLQLMERSDAELLRFPGFVKSDVDAGRRYRVIDVRKVQHIAEELLQSARDPTEAAFLARVIERLQGIERTFGEDEDLFDHVFGPPGSKTIASLGTLYDPAKRKELLKREASLQKDLGDLTDQLQGWMRRAEAQLEEHGRRAVWASVLLAIVAALLALLVMVLVTRALVPLRRLAASAKHVARGDYRQRVEVHSDDEVGSLANEFNAMAAALEERELRLIRSERLAGIGKIAAQITHEVRNPLSSIGLNAELLEEELGQLAASAEALKLARAIVKEVERLGEITEEYLNFARLPRPKLEGEDLNDLVSSLLGFMNGELTARGIQVASALAANLPAVPLDENQMRQALLNLMRNAAEAMATGGQLSVETGRDAGDWVCVRIRDTGEGIPEENRAKIFDPFFSTKRSGTGLGLSLTQQIVAEHGGSIDVDSAVGKGTTFTVRLPLPAA